MLKTVAKIAFAFIPSLALMSALFYTPSTVFADRLEQLIAYSDAGADVPESEEYQSVVSMEEFSENDTPAPKPNGTVHNLSANKATNARLELPFYRSQLSTIEQQIYDTLKDGLMRYNKNISFTIQPDTDTLTKCLQYVLNDNPEIFWVTNTVSYVKTGDSILSAQPEYKMDDAEIDAIRKDINNTVNMVVNDAKALATPYEKAKYYYTWICDNIEYDVDVANSQDVQGALYDKVTACAGYARALQMMCDASGITCIYVTGPAGGYGEEYVPHAWNMLEIDGIRSYVDATWGDRGSDGLACDYTWFCLSEEDLCKTHEFDERDIMPKNTSDEMSIWNMDNTIVADFHSADFYRMLEKSLVAGKSNITMRFADEAARDAAYNYLLSDTEIPMRIMKEHGELLPEARQRGIYAVIKAAGIPAITLEWQR